MLDRPPGERFAVSASDESRSNLLCKRSRSPTHPRSLSPHTDGGTHVGLRVRYAWRAVATESSIRTQGSGGSCRTCRRPRRAARSMQQQQEDRRAVQLGRCAYLGRRCAVQLGCRRAVQLGRRCTVQLGCRRRRSRERHDLVRLELLRRGAQGGLRSDDRRLHLSQPERQGHHQHRRPQHLPEQHQQLPAGHP